MLPTLPPVIDRFIGRLFSLYRVTSFGRLSIVRFKGLPAEAAVEAAAAAGAAADVVDATDDPKVFPSIVLVDWAAPPNIFPPKPNLPPPPFPPMLLSS
jgi:hypothetical protein